MHLHSGYPRLQFTICDGEIGDVFVEPISSGFRYRLSGREDM